MNNNNNGLLVIIAILVLGIFAFLLMNHYEKTPGEKISDGIGEVVEEIGDEIDDHTRN